MTYERLVDEATDTWEAVQRVGLCQEGDVVRASGVPLRFRVRSDGVLICLPVVLSEMEGEE